MPKVLFSLLKLSLQRQRCRVLNQRAHVFRVFLQNLLKSVSRAFYVFFLQKEHSEVIQGVYIRVLLDRYLSELNRLLYIPLCLIGFPETNKAVIIFGIHINGP